MTGDNLFYTVEVLGPGKTAKIYGLTAVSEYLEERLKDLPDEYWGHISIVKSDENIKEVHS